MDASYNTFTILIMVYIFISFSIFLINTGLILGNNDFMYETYKFSFFIGQIKGCWEDGVFFCPFDPEHIYRLTIIGKIIIGLIWVVFMLIPIIIAIIVSFIIWTLFHLCIKICIKNIEK